MRLTYLTAELKRLESEIKLPDIEEADLGDLSVTPDALKIVFSAIRISRDDERERTLTEMLLRIEPDLLEEPQVSQPMAFPLFGRRRALYALVGKGIVAWRHRRSVRVSDGRVSVYCEGTESRC